MRNFIVVKPGLHIVVTITQHACDRVLKRVLTLSGPGGEGLRRPAGQTHSCQSEISYSMTPKICDF